MNPIHIFWLFQMIHRFHLARLLFTWFGCFTYYSYISLESPFTKVVFCFVLNLSPLPSMVLMLFTLIKCKPVLQFHLSAAIEVSIWSPKNPWHFFLQIRHLLNYNQRVPSSPQPTLQYRNFIKFLFFIWMLICNSLVVPDTFQFSQFINIMIFPIFV